MRAAGPDKGLVRVHKPIPERKITPTQGRPDRICLSCPTNIFFGKPENSVATVS
jgi:hypothetical protein